MDRLICGDVGYGKTEVAIRAAFKACRTASRSAVLVPTTILAQQHRLTFRERMADFPVRVEVLSRFRTAKEQKDDARAPRRGKVDVVIGTHRLLSQGRASFAHLGLVVIDEEHRFGVAQKEKMRQLTRTVDVLALTATPIPRTLNLSLAGARDMSVIETPPRDRLPVNTEIMEQRRRGDHRRGPARGRPRRAGVLRPQPRRDDLQRRAAAAAAGAAGAGRGRARADARARARARDARVPREAAATCWSPP